MTERRNVALSAQLHDRLKAAADANRRTLAKQLEVIVESALAQLEQQPAPRFPDEVLNAGRR